MTKSGTAQAPPPQPPTPRPTTPTLQRILLTGKEQRAAAEAIAAIVGKDFVEKYPHGFTWITGANLVIAAVRAVNQTREGYPEGTICYHQASGQMARRYWSAKRGRLMWLVVDPADDDDLSVDGVEELAAIDETPWTVAHRPEWEFAPEGDGL